MPAQRIVIEIDEADMDQQVLFLTDEIQNIEAQLGVDGPRHEDGTPYTDEEFNAWRPRAIKSLNYKRSMKRHLQKYIADNRRKEARHTAGQKLRRLRHLAWQVVTIYDDSGSAAALSAAMTELRSELEQTNLEESV